MTLKGGPLVKATKKWLGYDPWKDGVTQGILSTYNDCKQKAKISAQGHTQQKLGHALEWGIVAHLILEKLHKLQSAKPKRWSPDEGLVVSTVNAVTDRYRRKHGQRWDGKRAEEFDHDVCQMIAVFPAYFNFWVKRPLDWVQVENTFAVPFRVPGFSKEVMLRGKLDGVYSSGGQWLFDAKTKSQIVESNFGETLLRDLQINFYMLALKIMSGKVPKGFLYNVIRRPGLKLGKNESLPDHVKRIRAHIADEPENYFKRYEVCIEASDLAAFQTELQGLLGEFLNWWQAKMPSRLFGMPCVGKYGMCENIGICYNETYTNHRMKEVMFEELLEDAA